MQRRFAAFALLVGAALASAPTPAIDPGTVQGHLQFGTGRHELRHVQAVRNPGNPKRLWILLTTTEISVKEAADPAAIAVLAASGRLRGVRLAVDAASPNPRELQGALLLGKAEAPAGEIVFGVGGEQFWERLFAGNNRVGGTLRYTREAGSGGTPSWTVDATFSAPVFGK